MLGATSLFTAEVDEAAGLPGMLATPGLPHSSLSSAADNLLVMRLVEQQSSLRRMIAVLKARNSSIDSRLRMFEIGKQGIEIAPGIGDPDAPRTGFMPGPSREGS